MYKISFIMIVKQARYYKTGPDTGSRWAGSAGSDDIHYKSFIIFRARVRKNTSQGGARTPSASRRVARRRAASGRAAILCLFDARVRRHISRTGTNQSIFFKWLHFCCDDEQAVFRIVLTTTTGSNGQRMDLSWGEG